MKNQRYFESFWILAFLDRGLSFTLIGLLIGFREICVAVLEIPTGTIADVVGRRRAMILSHVAYIVAYLGFAVSASSSGIFAAMFAFAVGDAFRTGTHKAIIFSWLKKEGRESEKTTVYGVTRSWSQVGSAVSVVAGACVVFVLQDYSAIFWLSAIPAALNIINFLGYPSDSSGQQAQGKPHLRQVLWEGARHCITNAQLRRPLIESMGYEGMYKTSKDYLQPIIQQIVLAAPILAMWEPTRGSAVAIALAYGALYLLGGLASRSAGRMRHLWGGDDRATKRLWQGFGLAFGTMLLGSIVNVQNLAVISIVVLAVLQNLWRPLLIGRITDHTDDLSLATVLSIESQAKSLGVAVLATTIGYCIDVMPEQFQFAPLGIFGLIIAGMGIASAQPHVATEQS